MPLINTNSKNDFWGKSDQHWEPRSVFTLLQVPDVNLPFGEIEATKKLMVDQQQTATACGLSVAKCHHGIAMPDLSTIEIMKRGDRKNGDDK